MNNPVHLTARYVISMSSNKPMKETVDEVSRFFYDGYCSSLARLEPTSAAVETLSNQWYLSLFFFSKSNNIGCCCFKSCSPRVQARRGETAPSPPIPLKLTSAAGERGGYRFSSTPPCVLARRRFTQRSGRSATPCQLPPPPSHVPFPSSESAEVDEDPLHYRGMSGVIKSHCGNLIIRTHWRKKKKKDKKCLKINRFYVQ